MWAVESKSTKCETQSGNLIIDGMVKMDKLEFYGEVKRLWLWLLFTTQVTENERKMYEMWLK
jgi:hypothetical protein